MKAKFLIDQYLKLAEQQKIIPNFYLSKPYLSKPYLELSGATGITSSGYIYIVDEDWCMFPVLHNDPLPTNYPMPKKIWSDFSNVEIKGYTSQFLDYEYIFNPVHFNDMNGNGWATYRKNTRKWPKHHEKWVYCSRFDKHSAGILLEQWFNKNPDEIQDADLIADFVVFSDLLGIHRKCLYDENEQLIAINVWDENYEYINYRFCIVKRDESFLDEFVRWLFYTDSEIQTKNKLVNDGGVLDNVGLERFKDKMNPVQKRKVYSWFKI